jgi:hypothetical protein
MSLVEESRIKESIRQLDEKFPHLREVTWNDRLDRQARLQKRLEEKEKKDNIGHEFFAQSGQPSGSAGQGCGIQVYSEWEDGIEAISGNGALV